MCDWNWEFVYLDLEFAPVFDWEKIRKRKGKNEIGVLFFAVFRVDSTRMCTLLCPSAAVWLNCPSAAVWLNSISLVFWFWYCYIACFFFCRTWPRRSKFWVLDFFFIFFIFFKIFFGTWGFEAFNLLHVTQRFGLVELWFFIFWELIRIRHKLLFCFIFLASGLPIRGFVGVECNLQSRFMHSLLTCHFGALNFDFEFYGSLLSLVAWGFIRCYCC